MNNEYYGVPSTPTEDFLMHYGVNGMKWGVRRTVKHKKHKNGHFKQDLKDAGKAAALSLVMGPGASMYMASRRAVRDDPGEMKRKKACRR